jgi:hypothetical protein
MNFALPALALFLAIVPGIAARRAYASGRFPREVSEQGGLQELATYLLFAVPIDAFAHVFFRGWVQLPSFAEVFRLVAGEFGTGQPGDLGLALAKLDWPAITVVYLVTTIAAFLLGSFLRRLVWASRWDIRFEYLRMHSDWFYLLQGRLPGIPRHVMTWADVLVDHEDKTRLYRGLVWKFELQNDGSIRELILIHPMRFSRKSDGSSPGENAWRGIPGSRFVLLGSKIQNLNLQYVVIERKKSRARDQWFRSFFYQDP